MTAEHIKGRVEISGGFFLLAAFLSYMDTDGLLLWAGLAAAVHELGHLLVICALGGRVSRLRLTCVGAEMRLASSCPDGRRFRILTALAGPAAGLLLAAMAAQIGPGGWSLAGISLSLSCFNLLPVAGLDGWRVLSACLTSRWGREALEMISLLASGGLAAAGLWAMLWTGNPTLFVTGSWLLLSAVRQSGYFSQIPTCVPKQIMIN